MKDPKKPEMKLQYFEEGFSIGGVLVPFGIMCGVAVLAAYFIMRWDLINKIERILGTGA